MDEELKRAEGLIKEGREDEAREILIQMLKKDQSNDDAWVWLASITENREKRQKCLEEALKHNPNNTTAKRVLQKMTAPPATNCHWLMPLSASCTP
jgi:Tfp pilus assembly protein PilF